MLKAYKEDSSRERRGLRLMKKVPEGEETFKEYG